MALPPKKQNFCNAFKLILVCILLLPTAISIRCDKYFMLQLKPDLVLLRQRGGYWQSSLWFGGVMSKGRNPST